MSDLQRVLEPATRVGVFGRRHKTGVFAAAAATLLVTVVVVAGVSALVSPGSTSGVLYGIALGLMLSSIALRILVAPLSEQVRALAGAGWASRRELRRRIVRREAVEHADMPRAVRWSAAFAASTPFELLATGSLISGLVVLQVANGVLDAGRGAGIWIVVVVASLAVVLVVIQVVIDLRAARSARAFALEHRELLAV